MTTASKKKQKKTKKNRRVANGTIQHWGCVEAGCPARVHTNVADVGDDVQIHSFNLRVLAQSSWAFMDGTFKATPRIYAQLYSIHGLYHEHFVPLVYALLSDTQRSSYHELFDIVQRELAEMDLVWDPDRIMSDFEPGLFPVCAIISPRLDKP